uniref:Uncharacterized protein n=1 Tax=Spongospora subterranea TaxID=70186 RepID=A0A0H5QZM4_9EUKA|eukprot:CRZ07324.1 hypothetical protein [Spongospora subterranea]
MTVQIDSLCLLTIRFPSCFKSFSKHSISYRISRCVITIQGCQSLLTVNCRSDILPVSPHPIKYSFGHRFQWPHLRFAPVLLCSLHVNADDPIASLSSISVAVIPYDDNHG